jgi:hypothetical protein
VGRPRKRPREWTTEEAMKKLFPPEVRREAKKTARSSEKKATKKDDTP